MGVPYYRADQTLIDLVPDKKAEQFATQGLVRAVRSRGRIVRIYQKSSERTYCSPSDFIRALNGAASTTERVRGVDGRYIAGPLARQHKERVQPADLYPRCDSAIASAGG